MKALMLLVIINLIKHRLQFNRKKRFIENIRIIFRIKFDNKENNSTIMQIIPQIFHLCTIRNTIRAKRYALFPFYLNSNSI